MKKSFEKTEWFRKAEYGFFFHFLNSGSALCPPENRSQRTPAPPAEWNRIVDRFDVDRLAKQLHEIRAGYAWITVGQNSGYYCAPNATYDRILGISGENSKCSKRDLVSDFADALAVYNIPLLAYTTCQAPGFDLDAVKHLKSIPPWNCNANCGNFDDVKSFAGTDPRLREFLRMWSDIHAEWMSRWGSKIKGWWVDGCYFADRLYDFADEPNGESFARALRTNTPDALVAFNPGVVYPPRRNYANSPEDYTAGEINEPEYGILNGPMVEGLQYHMLVCGGRTWGQEPARSDGRGFAGMTRNIVDNGGVVTWDLPFTVNGIGDELFSTLQDFAAEYQKSKQCFPKTEVRVTPPRIGADGIPVPGLLELNSERDAEIQMEWNGITKKVSGRQSGIPLSVPEANENRLNLSCGGFLRGFPVLTKKSFHFTETLSSPILLKKGTETLAVYRFSVIKNIFHVEALVEEEESQIKKQPWLNSCMELFISTDGVFKRQFCFRHDGKAFEVAKMVITELDDSVFSAERITKKQMRLIVDIPLEEQSRNGIFSFDIQQSVNRNGTALRGILFGMGSPYTFADVKTE